MDNPNFKNKTKQKTTLSSITEAKISFNLKSIHTTKRKKNTFTDRFSEQNKDLKIYANAKPKFKPKCLTSNVKKNSKTSKTRSRGEQQIIISWNNLWVTQFGCFWESERNKTKTKKIISMNKTTDVIEQQRERGESLGR